MKKGPGRQPRSGTSRLRVEMAMTMLDWMTYEGPMESFLGEDESSTTIFATASLRNREKFYTTSS